MKAFLCLAAILCVSVLHTGCSARAGFGNHDQHGAAVSTRTHGPHRGVHAAVY